MVDAVAVVAPVGGGNHPSPVSGCYPWLWCMVVYVFVFNV